MSAAIPANVSRFEVAVNGKVILSTHTLDTALVLYNRMVAAHASDASTTVELWGQGSLV